MPLIFRVEWRTEYDGVVNSNELYYRRAQIPDPDPGPEEDMIDAFTNPGLGMRVFLTRLMVDTATISCVIAEAVADDGPFVSARKILFDQAIVGALPDGLPPSSVASFNVRRSAPLASGRASPGNNLYLGALSKDHTVGPFFNDVFQQRVIDDWPKILTPQSTAITTPGVYVLQSHRTFTGAPVPPSSEPTPVFADFEDAWRLEPPFWPTKKNSRRTRLCT